MYTYYDDLFPPKSMPDFNSPLMMIVAFVAIIAFMWFWAGWVRKREDDGKALSENKGAIILYIGIFAIGAVVTLLDKVM